jgi:hypothetical protein
MCCATFNQEKRNTTVLLAKTKIKDSKAEPVKPKPDMSTGPNNCPSTPPASPGSRSAKVYKRVHSKVVLAAKSTHNDVQNPTMASRQRCQGVTGAAGAAARWLGSAPRNHWANAESH